MKGGYLEDRYINGVNQENCFFFVHWAAVDIFGYFSHHLVSIPPCSWISAAHINGVQVIGTFITEWDEGVEVFENVFTDKKSIHELCKQLVNIATYYNFDGWLINIENEVKPYQIPLLKYFVKSLTTMMHAYIPGSQVIWYDSVLKNGDLSWQNCLNDLNRVFFLNADAIFLDYHWNEEKLLLTKLQAGDRCADVYVGVDVFGRGNCFTEGGFSTDISVKEIRKHGLSAGIFAPGWVYECLEIKDFKENQFKFWGSLQELIPPRIFGDLPYCSSFCPGFGDKMFRNGKVIDDKPWYNMNLQQPQPIYYSSPEKGLTLYSDDAFNGGGCLCLSGSIINEEKAIEFNILKTSFCLENACLITYTFKPLVKDMDIGLCLDMLSSQEQYKLYLVDFKSKVHSDNNPSVKRLTPIPTDEILKTGYKIDQEIFEQQTWIKRMFLLNADDFSYHCIQNISVVASWKKATAETASILLGELEVLPLYPVCNLTYEDLTCKRAPADSQTIDVECILKWQPHSSIFCYDLYIQVLNEDKRFICTTNQTFCKLKCNVNLASEMIIILHPKTAGSESFPAASIRIPLEA
ncbi:cytosolic endo-beta-N-acetylglucosaminidase-like isoform X2 [Argiope bruennichi]|nr:cytosolic endo-beta-N-acetylglucosaminidase-like isoform X2 [Argiope bruennichi]